MHIYKNIKISNETIENLKHCLDRVFNKNFKGPEYGLDLWPLEIQYIIEEWESAEIEEITNEQ